MLETRGARNHPRSNILDLWARVQSKAREKCVTVVVCVFLGHPVIRYIDIYIYI